MEWAGPLQSIGIAIALAIIFGISKLFQRLSTLETKVQPVIDWYVRTSMDALKLATNPTSERLAELADRYIAHVRSGMAMPNSEKRELIDGLLEIYNDKASFKRQSASVSLRFIESQERIHLLPLEQSAKPM